VDHRGTGGGYLLSSHANRFTLTRAERPSALIPY
jgi:hypothetical protein